MLRELDKGDSYMYVYGHLHFLKVGHFYVPSKPPYLDGLTYVYQYA